MCFKMFHQSVFLFNVFLAICIMTKTINIVTREEWGADYTDSLEYLELPVKHVFTGFTNTDQCLEMSQGRTAMRTLQRTHVYKQLSDIRYNFVIATDARIYEGRGWLIQPAILKKHQDYQSNALFITFFWKTKEEEPPDIMYECLDNMLEYGVKHEFIARKFLLHHLRPF